jgi:VPDSG-CTERM motif
MKRLKLISAGCAMALLATAFATSARANDTVEIFTNSNSDYVSQLGGYGGEFTAITGSFSSATSTTALTNLGYVVGKSISTANGEYGFDTFCVQETVQVYTGSKDYYKETNTFTPDGPLTVGAAWLYAQFATGKLPTADYTSATDCAEIQNAIWYLQGETMYNGYTTSNDPFLATNIISQFGTLTAAKAADSLGGYGVEIMALTTGNNGTGTALQDQLILTGGPTGTGPGTPIPDAGATVGLLGIALAGLSLVRRKLLA